ncbi:uncharacterized protein LOC135093426 [Scylla paramamosain]|uniref:uncharacterized protein LOC135093426 n=1 Tax=Scylla paramamosain TaxID=85552 RepID=UPI003082A540
MATAIHLLAQRVSRWWCLGKARFCPIVTVDLDPARREKVTDAVTEYPHCCVTVNWETIKQVDADCFVKIKVKRNKKTIRKQAIDARRLLECLQDLRPAPGRIHVALDVCSYHPLSVRLEVNTDEGREPEDRNGSSCPLTESQIPQETLAPSPPLVWLQHCPRPQQSSPAASQNLLIETHCVRRMCDGGWPRRRSANQDDHLRDSASQQVLPAAHSFSQGRHVWLPANQGNLGQEDLHIVQRRRGPRAHV